MSERAAEVHPLPLPPAEHVYGIGFTVEAETYLEAVTKATGMLRSDVHLVDVHRVTPKADWFWEVTLKVWEEA